MSRTAARAPLPLPRPVPAARPNGWWGMAIFIASESTLFGCLFGSYFYLRFHAAHWPPDGIAPPSTVVPLLLVGVLALTSVPMQLARRAARDGRVNLTRAAIVVALVVQTGYFAMQMHLFADDLHRFTPQADAYGSIYYTLLGADHAHVLVGILFNLWLVARLVGGLTRHRALAVNVVTFYWHAVNLISLLVVGAILSPAV